MPSLSCLCRSARRHDRAKGVVFRCMACSRVIAREGPHTVQAVTASPLLPDSFAQRSTGRRANFSCEAERGDVRVDERRGRRMRDAFERGWSSLAASERVKPCGLRDVLVYDKFDHAALM